MFTFTSFDEGVFRKAIAEKDFLRLKTNAVSAISYDPTFEKGEANAVLEILKNEVPEIFEEYKEGEYEERLERSKWDKRYFSKLTYWFQENFSEDRIPLIKEVGREVYPKADNMAPKEERVHTDGARSDRTGSSGKASGSGNTKKEYTGGQSNFPEAPRRKNRLVGILVAIVAFVAAVGALVRVGMWIVTLLLKLFAK